MNPAGLPDFQRPLTLADGPVWPAFGDANWLAPPSVVKLAPDADGRPAFRLSITRPAVPFLPPPPYGVLDLSLAAVRDGAAALTALRAEHPGAVLSPLESAAGWVRLQPGPGVELPEGLGDPISLSWNGLGTARFNLRLEADAATRVAMLVEDGTMPLTVGMTLAFDGVSPRLDARVSFDPVALLAALAPLLPGDGASLQDLTAALGGSPEALPLQVDAGAGRDPAFAETLADRLVARFAAAPVVDAGQLPRFRLSADGGVAGGRFDWDLAEPVQARRWMALQVDPFAELRAFIAANGAATLVTRNTSQPIPTGSQLISAFANLPRDRVGLDTLGVTVRAAPAPPHRPQAVVATALLEAPADRADLRLQLAPGEPLDYSAQGFAVLVDAVGVQQLTGPERRCSGPVLRLLPEDFAMLPLALAAAPDLLQLARLEGTLSYRLRDLAHTLDFALDLDRPSAALALPADAAEASLAVVARALAGDGLLDLGVLPARPRRFELTSFATYGPQLAAIRCPPPPGTPVIALELIPDGRNEDPAEIVPLAFSAAEPAREWHYFSPSPFLGGFRWRIRAGPDETPQAWRHRDPSADPLVVDVLALDVG